MCQNTTGVFIADTPRKRQAAFEVRKRVFVDEQGVPSEIEWDEYDAPQADTHHFVSFLDGSPVGAARWRRKTTTAGKVERVAVIKSARGNGWGRRLMNAVETDARSAGIQTSVLHAQLRVIEFYHTLGYRHVGSLFEESDIPHIKMTKSLRS